MERVNRIAFVDTSIFNGSRVSVVFCKSKFPNFADKNGESCISVLEKVADRPAALPRLCRNSTADMLLS